MLRQSAIRCKVANRGRQPTLSFFQISLYLHCQVTRNSEGRHAHDMWTAKSTVKLLTIFLGRGCWEGGSNSKLCLKFLRNPSNSRHYSISPSTDSFFFEVNDTARIVSHNSQRNDIGQNFKHHERFKILGCFLSSTKRGQQTYTITLIHKLLILSLFINSVTV